MAKNTPLTKQKHFKVLCYSAYVDLLKLRWKIEYVTGWLGLFGAARNKPQTTKNNEREARLFGS